MSAAATEVDNVFRALSDGTRRQVLERLSKRAASVSELAEPFDMALPSFVQHLNVLEECGLVRSQKTGRVRIYRLAPKQLKLAETWLTRQRSLWERRLDQLDSYLLELKAKDSFTMTVKFDPKTDLVLDRTVDVPRHLVWTAWTRPEHVVKWFTPAPWSTVSADIDLRPGGKYNTTMRSPEGKDFPNFGCILECITNERLVMTDTLLEGFRPAATPFFTAIITLESKGNGTRYIATAMHRDEAGRKQHEEMGFMTGWGKALDQLVAYVKTIG